MNSDLAKIVKEIVEQSKAEGQPIRYDDLIMQVLSRRQGESSLAELSACFGPEDIDQINEALGDLFLDGMVDVCSIGSETTCELTQKGISWTEKQDSERGSSE